MARIDPPPIYKTKIKRDEAREADKGDTKEIDGEEYESLGYMKKVKEPNVYESDMSEEDRKSKMSPDEKDVPRLKGGTEFWRRKKKKETPTS